MTTPVPQALMVSFVGTGSHERIEDMSTNDNRQKVFEIINDNPVCMFTVSGAGDALLSRPMTVIKTEDNGELWFFTSSDAATVAEIGTESEVNLSFSGKGEWLSLHGSAVTVTSEPKARLTDTQIDAGERRTVDLQT